MPGRAIPLINKEIYHVFNRGIDHRPTFLEKREYNRALEVIKFYRYKNLPIRLSYFLTWSQNRRNMFLTNFPKNTTNLIHILTYTLMPNHFHFLLQQNTDLGIAKFMSNFLNSYTRYFNTKHKRIGPLFLDQFKAVRIETDEQLLHVSRYIHLNPYTAFLVKNLEDLIAYPWSSLGEFLSMKKGVCLTTPILSYFKFKDGYRNFIANQADYQRHLGAIKHLILENP